MIFEHLLSEKLMLFILSSRIRIKFSKDPVFFEGRIRMRSILTRIYNPGGNIILDRNHLLGTAYSHSSWYIYAGYVSCLIFNPNSIGVKYFLIVFWIETLGICSSVRSYDYL